MFEGMNKPNAMLFEFFPDIPFLFPDLGCIFNVHPVPARPLTGQHFSMIHPMPNGFVNLPPIEQLR